MFISFPNKILKKFLKKFLMLKLLLLIHTFYLVKNVVWVNFKVLKILISVLLLL